jgi:hypothetical protein
VWQDFSPHAILFQRFGIGRPAYYHERLFDNFLASTVSFEFNYYYRVQDIITPGL